MNRDNQPLLILGELENGEKAPTLLTITALARALHVKTSELIEGYEGALEEGHY